MNSDPVDILCEIATELGCDCDNEAIMVAIDRLKTWPRSADRPGTSFLQRPESERRLYVARLMGQHPDDPSSWPMDMIDGVIAAAEHAAERTARDEVSRIMGGVSR